MSETALTTALAVLLAAAPVYAQTTAPRETAPAHRTIRTTAPREAAPANRMTRSSFTPSSFTTSSGALRASKVIGSTVYDVQNQNIGSVKDIVLRRDGKAAAVIDAGSGKNVAVALNDIKTANDRLTLNRSKEQLQSAQPYTLTNDNNR